MSESLIAKVLLELATLFVLTYLLAGILARFRIPPILGALFIAMLAHYTPLGESLLSAELYPTLVFLAQLGAIFLLFFIGLQIDVKDMRGLGGDIMWCTFLNTFLPFVFGVVVMLVLGYGWVLAFVIGLTRMPTAEAVVVPILDEFQMIRTRVGKLIVTVGTLDDILEVILIAIVSIWIGQRVGMTPEDVTSGVVSILSALTLFVVVAWLAYRWILPWLANWLPARERYLLMLSVTVLFASAGYTEYNNLGIVVGALIAGIVMRPVFNSSGIAGEHLTGNLQSLSFGFLGLIFFFWVGLSVDLHGVTQDPKLTLLLYLAGTLGKLLGVFLMVPLKRLNPREALIVGVGLDARLTTEIIVAKLLLDAQLIDTHLFTALVTAASFTALTVPVAFALLLRHWGAEMRTPLSGMRLKDNPHAK